VTPPTGAKWLAPTGGAIREGDGTSDVRIQWGAGPAVGKAIYQLNADYIWDLGVNVVKVTVEAPDQGPAFDPGNVIDDGVSPAGYKIVTSAKQAKPGLKWQAKVTFTGPNDSRGVAQMRAGFVQNLIMTSQRGDYGNKTAVSSLEGHTYWDAKPAYIGKFYSNAAGAFFEDATPANRTSVIAEDDSPFGGPPGTSPQNGPLTSMSLVWDFRLYVVSLTKDTRNSADTEYAGESRADWQFNGTGQIVNPNNPALPWQGNGAGITPPQAWQALDANSAPPVLDPPRFNDAVQQQGWNFLP
jgi:hypothetical protein